MQVSVTIEVEQSKESVWATISDIQGVGKVISGIIDLEILAKPESGLVGLKWKETRSMFGKEASEVMWVTEAKEGEYYCTRAESHGSVYNTKLSVMEVGDMTLLTMAFGAEAQTLPIKLLSACMSIFMKRSMKKMLLKDLEDIKTFVEKANR